ncbi:hypothetical protein FXW78_40295 [Rhodococcus opacus]|nr:hypothetical protein [Rhodococcus opacus]RZL77872.1 MAG: hypothetical protein EOP32_23715 [Rhodococcus sp. (in: high G+C Gram-positive bacteria)]
MYREVRHKGTTTKCVTRVQTTDFISTEGLFSMRADDRAHGSRKEALMFAIIVAFVLLTLLLVVIPGVLS